MSDNLFNNMSDNLSDNISEPISETHTEKTTSLIQGYLWYPQTLELDLGQYLPTQWEEVHLLWDEIHPPFAFFENGTLTSSQHFFQFTSLVIYKTQPSNDEVHARAEVFSQVLHTWLEATPAGVGWQLWEDLRPLE
jgi:hypothetical protein